MRRVENVQAYYQRDLWGLLVGKFKIRLDVGRKTHLSAHRVAKAEFQAMSQRSQDYPVAYLRAGERTYWRFAGCWYTDNENLEAAAVHALLVTRQQRRQRQVDRAQAMVAIGERVTPTARQVIPDDVKQFVYLRDGGACVSCGSTTEIQFDHIIPVAMGGSNEQENLQLLCGPCNRRKSSGLTVRNETVARTNAAEIPEQPSSSPPASWYPDPAGSGQLRYWDGVAWTEHLHAGS